MRRRSSTPAIVVAAEEKLLKPSMGRVLDLIPRWSCSIRLFRYLEDRNLVRLGSSPSSCISRTAGGDATSTAAAPSGGRHRSAEAPKAHTRGPSTVTEVSYL